MNMTRFGKNHPPVAPGTDTLEVRYIESSVNHEVDSLLFDGQSFRQSGTRPDEGAPVTHGLHEEGLEGFDTLAPVVRHAEHLDAELFQWLREAAPFRIAGAAPVGPSVLLVVGPNTRSDWGTDEWEEISARWIVVIEKDKLEEEGLKGRSASEVWNDVLSRRPRR